MSSLLVLLAALLIAPAAFAQDAFRVTVKDESTKRPLAGVTVSVKETAIAATTDAGGRAELINVPAGHQIIEVFSPGYEMKTLRLTFPLADPGEQEVFIKVNNELGEVTITSTTRISREIDDVPTRIEAISEEEIDEKMNMRPANVSMVLNESTGIKVQQTSATSNTASIRIQGLDGRYTQILKDGFPAFGGFSGSLSLLDIPPLDLKQVEIIKGPSATFYGGAIAGVINFVSKEPDDKRVTAMIFNQTTARGTDFSLFEAHRFKRTGYTFLGSINYQRAYDVDGDDFTELPQTTSFNLNPRAFFYLNDRSRLIVGNSTSYQNRKGGDVFVIRGKADDFHQYFEADQSLRNITTLQFDRELAAGHKLIARQSLAFFDRRIEIPDYSFKGRQANAYTDLTYFLPAENHALVFGANAAIDRFRERGNDSPTVRRDEARTSFGGYAQDNLTITSRASLEAGFRLDYLKDYRAFALPRVSLLYRFSDHLSSRLSFGLGYKAPSIFTEEAEMLLFQNVLPIGNRLRAETSRGGTFDINYRNQIGEKISYALNQMFFYTRIKDPLLLLAGSDGLYRFTNAGQPIRSAGFETNARLVYGLVKLFAGYTYTDAEAGYLSGDRTLPLVAKSRLNSALLVEKEASFKAGVEAYYTSSQLLSNRLKTPPYWVLGIFGEKSYGKISLFVNAENITDTRQSRFGPVVFPPHQRPTFSEIYTHTEGRVFNGGIKIKL